MFEEIFYELMPQNLFLRKGERVFNQGDCVTNIYLIKKGKIKLIRNTMDGTPVILHVGEQGGTIAEASLFSNNYHCSAIADSVSELVLVKKDEVLLFLEKNPKAMMKLLTLFSYQVRDLRAINEIKNIRSAKERVLSYIKCNIDENKEMKLELSLKDISHKIGLAHETFYREMKKLEESGIIKRDKIRIKLL